MAGLSIAIRGVTSSVGQLQSAGLLVMTKNKAIEAPRSLMVPRKKTNTPSCHLMRFCCAYKIQTWLDNLSQSEV